jgi:hypothetical protein
MAGRIGDGQQEGGERTTVARKDRPPDADGSVHFLANSIDLTLYRALATVSGGEVASPP